MTRKYEDKQQYGYFKRQAGGHCYKKEILREKLNLFK